MLERHSYIVWPNVLENLNPSQKEYLEQWVKTHHGINKVKNKKLTKEEGQRIVTPNVQIYIDQINSYVRSLNPPTLKLPSAKDAEKLTEIQKLMRSVFTRHGSSQGFYRYFLDEDLKLNPNILWEMDKYKFIENWLINNPNLGMPQIDGHGLEQKNMRVWINKNGGVQALIEKLPDRLRSFPGVRVTMLKIGMLDPAEEMVKWVIAHKSWPSPQHIKSDIDPVEQKKKEIPCKIFYTIG